MKMPLCGIFLIEAAWNTRSPAGGNKVLGSKAACTCGWPLQAAADQNAARDARDGNGDNNMRALIQRVARASVTIDGAVHGSIGQGFLVLLGITDGDTADDAVYLADKVVRLRVFTDDDNKMNRSLADVGGGILIVSQFTLYGDCKKGNRPSFTAAARPETAIPLYETFIARCRESGLPVETGEFGADMKVDLLNDGPVTLWMDTAQMRCGKGDRL